MSEFRELLDRNGIADDSVECIAFDVFDTILHRHVSPDEVLHLWACDMVEELSLMDTPATLLIKRRIAGWLVKFVSVLTGYDKECRYPDLIRVLYYMVLPRISFFEFYRRALDTEVGVEKKVTFIPESKRKLIASAFCMEKPVICISDYPLPEESEKEILKYHGIEVERLFTSSDWRFLKSTGRLYKRAIECMRVDPLKAIMIGDNYHSDYIKAKEEGMQAIYLDNSNISTKSNAPFSKAAGMLYVFTERLYRQLVKDGCSTALFLSREGIFLKKLFDYYQRDYLKRHPGKPEIKSRVFFCSRQAALISSIFTASREEFAEIYKNYPTLRVSDFLRNLNMLEDIEIQKEFGELLQNDRLIDDFEHSREYRTILNSEMFSKKCIDNSDEQRKLLVSYIESLSPDFKREGLYLIDIGYHGTCSNLIGKALGGGVRVQTYYLLSRISRGANLGNGDIKGILYDNKKADRFNVYAYDEMFMEKLLSAGCGSVNGYCWSAGEVKPVLSDENTEYYDRIVQPVQDHLYKRYCKIARYLSNHHIDIARYEKRFEKEYMDLIFTPTREEMNLYMQIPMKDNFAAYRYYKTMVGYEAYKEFSFESFVKLLSSKEMIIRSQGTKWIEVALYTMNLNILNRLLREIPYLAIKAYNTYIVKNVI